MAALTRLRNVYSFEEVYDPGRYSPADTLKTYSFGWMYSGSNYGYVELCEGSIAKLEWSGDGLLEVTVYSNGNRCWENAVKELADIIGLNEILDDYATIARGDPLVGGLIETMPGLRFRKVNIWYAFLVGVCQQNASFRQGWTMLYKLHLNSSERLYIPPGHIYLPTPSPRFLTYDVLRASGLGYRASTIMNLINAKVWELDCSTLDAALSVRGVGRYTLALAGILACRQYERLPMDRWLRRLAAEAYGVSEKQVEDVFTRKFGRWRGLAALHTTIAFDAEPLRRALQRLRRGANRPGLTEPSPITLWKYTPPPRVEA